VIKLVSFLLRHVALPWHLMPAGVCGARPDVDRSRLPSLPDYLADHGIRIVGQGRRRRADCDLAAHTHRLSMGVDTERGLWFCHGCAIGGDVIELHMRRTGLAFLDAARELGALVDGMPSAARQNRPQQAIATQRVDDGEQARKSALAADLWRQARLIEPGSPAHEYLVGRACVPPPMEGDLRWLPDLRLFGFSGPAMVGRISVATDARRGLGLHCTWLARDGDCWHRTERRFLGPKAGGVIRLWPDEAVTQGLAIAEGIETALALAHAFTPVWAVIDAGNMAALPVLEVDSLLIAADHDPAGTKAAQACAQRWADAGREVAIAMPPGERQDVNDLARAA